MGREDAPGWREAAKQGTEEECLVFVRKVWTHMRPLSLCQRMALQAAL